MSHLSIAELNNMLDNGLDVYRYYIQGQEVQILKNLKSPLPGRDDKHPSFRLYPHKTSGIIMFSDHSTGQWGNHWKFAALMNGLDTESKQQFKEVVDMVKRDVLGIGAGSVIIPRIRTEVQVKPKIQPTIITIDTISREWNTKDLVWFNQFGITEEILSNFHVHAASQYILTKHVPDQVPKVSVIREKVDDPIYAFGFESGRKKVYRPHAKDKRFKWMSNTQGDKDIFGFHLLPRVCKNLFLTAGNKDTMAFYALTGLPCAALSSETASIDRILLVALYSIAENIYTVYDNDAAGEKGAQKLYNLYGIEPRNEPILQFAGYDFAQLMQHHQENPFALQSIKNYYLNI